MTALKIDPRRMAGAAALALGAVQLAACASGPAKTAAPVAAAAPPAALAAPTVVTMAPIPNPVEPSSHERRASSHGHAPPAKHEHAKAASTAPTATAAPGQSQTDPAKAARLRARGLEELDRGAVGQAVALLTEASQLDPSNTLIRRDLDRAERIARAVHDSK